MIFSRLKSCFYFFNPYLFIFFEFFFVLFSKLKSCFYLFNPYLFIFFVFFFVIFSRLNSGFLCFHLYTAPTNSKGLMLHRLFIHFAPALFRPLFILFLIIYFSYNRDTNTRSVLLPSIPKWVGMVSGSLDQNKRPITIGISVIILVKIKVFLFIFFIFISTLSCFIFTDCFYII